ncbi:uncharacterized protein EI97DRAFT_464307 [Westerdykella ornata]|uniref:Uncharacterized protein n=1 Tax=Westerdykella ornata TaxID=318751 RepID=A0A6A6JUM8_WESOR|nr:uncharacterized protein EI97DRAFT_464307 [Westerdykella ornata]KAF2280331.1 hypothetical protein EI97DRAFT_464307 [Westerdykella ornata]
MVHYNRVAPLVARDVERIEAQLDQISTQIAQLRHKVDDLKGEISAINLTIEKRFRQFYVGGSYAVLAIGAAALLLGVSCIPPYLENMRLDAQLELLNERRSPKGRGAIS